jgi:3D (Asp-Asp-Asp) domain-containing protein
MITVTQVITLLWLSAYAPSLGQINCDHDCTVMAGGNAPYEGALACPSWIPLGTVIELDNSPNGLTSAICEDRGGSVTGNRVDYCLTGGNVAARAASWGRRAVLATIWLAMPKPPKPFSWSDRRHRPI